MQDQDISECQVHAYVCTNERTPDKSCCKKVGGQEFFQRLKQTVKDKGLYNTHWITRTGCLGFCNDVGTVVSIHRKGEAPRCFTEVMANDFEKVWSEITR